MKKQESYCKTGRDVTHDEIRKGVTFTGTTAKRNIEKPPMGVKKLPKMSDSLDGQLNCDHSNMTVLDPNKGKKIPRNQRRNNEHIRYDDKGSTI